MERITGIGGVFFKARDPHALAAWYQEHLGVPMEARIQEEGYGRFGWAMDPEGNRIELWEPPAAEG
jgi:predicted enzyme related to lactoylglutathione lyase